MDFQRGFFPSCAPQGLCNSLSIRPKPFRCVRSSRPGGH